MEYIASAAAGYAGPAPNEEKYFISMEEVSCAALTIQRGWSCTRKRIVLRAAGGPATSRGVFASGSQRQGKDREPQGYAIPTLRLLRMIGE